MGASTGCVFYEPNDKVFSTISEDGKKAIEDTFQKLKSNQMDPYAFVDQYCPKDVKVGG